MGKYLGISQFLQIDRGRLDKIIFGVDQLKVLHILFDLFPFLTCFDGSS